MRINITTPNLPDNKVGLVLVKNDPDTVKALAALGIEALSPAPNPSLAAEVSEHPDMLCCHIGSGVCVVSPEQTALKAELISRGFTVYDSSPLSEKYPGDIALDFAVCDDFILGNIRYADKYLMDINKKIINVRQGYAKCSTCFVTKNAFITEDTGIAAALKNLGADVLLIGAGDIYLSDRHSGFFGGATGKLSDTVLAVNGSLKYHRDGDRIRAFLAAHGVEPAELFDSEIKDTGGIIPLQEDI